MKKSDASVNISPFYQRVFIAAALLAWLVQAGIIAFEAISNHGYHVSEIWLFQLSAWGVPLYFFILSSLFYRKRCSGQKLLFSATLLATAGVLFYDSLTTIMQTLLGLYISRHAFELNTNSFWDGSGIVCLTLGIGVVLFPLALYFLRKRKDI